MVDFSVVTVCPIFRAVGSWEEVFFFSMDFTSVPELFGVCVAGSTFLLEKASLGFSNSLCILVSSFPEK